MKRQVSWMTPREEELDEWACRAFNPDNQVTVLLPGGAVARVSPNVSPEVLTALDRMAVAMLEQWQRRGDENGRAGGDGAPDL